MCQLDFLSNLSINRVKVFRKLLSSNSLQFIQGQVVQLIFILWYLSSLSFPIGISCLKTLLRWFRPKLFNLKLSTFYFHYFTPNRNGIFNVQEQKSFSTRDSHYIDINYVFPKKIFSIEEREKGGISKYFPRWQIVGVLLALRSSLSKFPSSFNRIWWRPLWAPVDLSWSKLTFTGSDQQMLLTHTYTHAAICIEKTSRQGDEGGRVCIEKEGQGEGPCIDKLLLRPLYIAGEHGVCTRGYSRQ